MKRFLAAIGASFLLATGAIGQQDSSTPRVVTVGQDPSPEAGIWLTVAAQAYSIEVKRRGDRSLEERTGTRADKIAHVVDLALSNHRSPHLRLTQQQVAALVADGVESQALIWATANRLSLARGGGIEALPGAFVSHGVPDAHPASSATMKAKFDALSAEDQAAVRKLGMAPDSNHCHVDGTTVGGGNDVSLTVDPDTCDVTVKSVDPEPAPEPSPNPVPASPLGLESTQSVFEHYALWTPSNFVHADCQQQDVAIGPLFNRYRGIKGRIMEQTPAPVIPPIPLLQEPPALVAKEVTSVFVGLPSHVVATQIPHQQCDYCNPVNGWCGGYYNPGIGCSVLPGYCASLCPAKLDPGYNWHACVPGDCTPYTTYSPGPLVIDGMQMHSGDNFAASLIDFQIGLVAPFDGWVFQIGFLPRMPSATELVTTMGGGLTPRLRAHACEVTANADMSPTLAEAANVSYFRLHNTLGYWFFRALQMLGDAETQSGPEDNSPPNGLPSQVADYLLDLYKETAGDDSLHWIYAVAVKSIDATGVEHKTGIYSTFGGDIRGAWASNRFFNSKGYSFSDVNK